MVIFRYIGIIGLLIQFVGCSSFSKKGHLLLRESFKEGNFFKAHEILAKLSPAIEPDSKLLYFMEKGSLWHAQGKYDLSRRYFDRAIDLIKELYTVRISKKITATIISESSDLYYGARFEHSMVYYYQIMNFFMLYKKGSTESRKQIENSLGKSQTPEIDNEMIQGHTLTKRERMDMLQKARSTVRAWDSKLNSWKKNLVGKSFYKDDLLSKVVGAMVHEETGSRSDRMVALNLYKDALSLLFRQYNTYKSLNTKSIKFQKNYSKFSELSEGKVRSTYVHATHYQSKLERFLKIQILRLSSTLQKKYWNREVKALGANKEMIAMAKTKKMTNIQVLLNFGLIPERKEKKYFIGLRGLLKNIKNPATRAAVSSIGGMALTNFAIEILGLEPAPKDASYAAVGLLSANLAAHHAGIGFSLPIIDNPKTDELIWIEIKNERTGKTVSRELNLTNPLGDMAEQAVEENRNALYARTGVRVGLKHIAAILTCYKTYHLLKSKIGSFLAKSAAVLEYTALSKGIASSESADLRYWGTLPKDIRFSQLYLDPGTYSVVLRVKSSSGTKETVLRKISIDKKSNGIFINHRISRI
ncbi:hypothetical protein OAB57_01255 [Bacteriovoracaceae bacterium]|nr:hypothetical protein [Bacteriovoracaceae bacterium]